jgi:tRNA1(Val) A37 N6-methylase TrmN6
VPMGDAVPDNAVTEDRLLGGRVHLIQPARGYRAGIDPVLLAAAVPATPGDRVLDLGAGAGAAALCLAARVAGVLVVGLEADAALMCLARAGAERSGLGDRTVFHAADIRNATRILSPETYDHVMANPPFMAMGTGRMPPDAGKAAATVESGATLGDWIRVAATMVRHGGTVTVIHRGDRLDAVLASLAGRLGAITIYPLWPDRSRPAKRVIVAARKGSAAPLRLLRGLVLHAEGAFTAEADAVLRHARPLPLATPRY